MSAFVFFLGYQASQLTFDYDFEKFFPGEDDELDFFKEYRTVFENDNDFVMIAVENNQGIFKEEFLQESQQFVADLEKAPHVRQIVSPINARYPKISPGSMLPKYEPYIHIDQASLYKKDSLFFRESKELIAGMLSFESSSICIFLKHKQFINKKEADELSKGIDEIVEKYNFDEVHMISKIHGQKEYIKTMKDEFLLFTSISVFILLVFLFITYRSIWGLIVPLITVVIAVIGSCGFMQLSGKSLNMMTVLLPIIMLVVGMSDVVHLVSKYLEEIRLGRNKYLAIQLMLKKVGMATLLTSITTAVGFATLISIDMEPARDFGIYIAIGVLMAFVVSIVFIPAIFTFMGKPKIIDVGKLRNQWERVLGKIFIKVVRKRKWLYGVYSIVTIMAIFGINHIKFDYFLMHDLSEEVPLMQELDFFQTNFGGIRPFELAVIAKGDSKVDDFEVLQEIEKIEEYLIAEYGVTQMTSPLTPYQFINKVGRNGREEFYRLPKREKRFDYVKKQVNQFADSALQSLISPNGKMGRISGRINDPGSYEMLQRNDRLGQFINSQIDTTLVDYQLTGTPVIVDKSSRYLSKNVITGLLFAFMIIALMMGILFRSIKMALLSLIPNLFPIILTAGFIGYIGVSLNMATSLVFTIAFGIAVDDTIHFLSRYRQEMNRGISTLWAVRRTYLSTGKAIIITTIILIGGFGSLIFSDFLSTYYIGLFVCLTLISAVITDLTLLPLLLLGKKKI